MSYSEKLHIVRMAGCFNEVMDDLDEFTLPPEFMDELIKQILPEINLPSLENMEEYYEVLSEAVKKYGRIIDVFGHKRYMLDVEQTIRLIFGLKNKYNCIFPCVVS